MNRLPRPGRRFAIYLGLGVMVAGLLGLLVACAEQGKAAASGASLAQAGTGEATSQPSTPEGAAPAPTATPLPLKLLKVQPDNGIVGDSFTITAEGLPAAKLVEFTWVTWEGSYRTEAGSENVEYHDREYGERRVSLGQVHANSHGQASLQVAVPEDYGQVHDIYAVVEGEDLARGGFRIARNAAIKTSAGPVGAPITITVTGLGVRPYESTAAVTYDNKHAGFATGVTTRGTATFHIRAAGPPGEHLVQVIGSSHASPYLNVPQSPLADIISNFSWVYTVTEDAGPPADVIEWPDASRVARVGELAMWTSSSGFAPQPGVSATIEPGAGPVLSQATVTASGLPPEAELDLLWVTSRGNRVSPSGWSLSETPLTRATAGRDGSLSASVEIPDDLGGWHAVKLVQGEEVLAEIPYRIEHSLIGVRPKRVKAGETFTVHVKGVGWTELDNAFAVTYDNAYVGYACGFNSNGDVQLALVATGGPGTHLVDLYPMLYQGHGKPPWAYQMPMLTFARDHPGLALAYRLPAIRAAVEIVE